MRPGFHGLPTASSPRMRRFNAGSASGHRAANGTAKCPESLRPISVMPLSGSRISSPQRALPLRHRYYGLMRQPRWFSSPSALASFEESLPVATSPGYPRDLPDVISANLSSDAWSLATAVPPGALACFFPDVIGLPQQRCGSASRFTREHDFSAERFSTLQTFLNVQASEFARLPDRSYRCAYHLRAAETFTSGHRALRCLRTHRICYPSEYRQLTVRGLSPRRIRGLVGCSPLFTLRWAPRDATVQNSRPSGSLLLSRKALSSSASDRFIPAHQNPLVSIPICYH